ncbi:MAG TPA: S46 family peptidase [Caulobacteraceae bacterium]|nr:S46 family peptidase [Caulobacteraceae bacterium]
MRSGGWLKAIVCGMALWALGLASAWADEGMWTFDAFPAAAARKALGVSVDPAWLDHVRMSTLRLVNGCSGAVVSAHGLAATNYHCMADCVQTLTTSGADLIDLGFAAQSEGDERPCPGLQAEILVGWSDITEKVRAASATTAEREAEIAHLERGECAGDPILRCQAVSLYHGARYVLYRFRKYTDVRLVFAPEYDIALFGGDPDNFNFPRYDFDTAFIRLYVDGKAAATSEHLIFDETAPKAGQPVFVAGNPGATERLATISELEAQRDVILPLSQVQRAEERGRLLQFAAESPAHKRAATEALFSLENTFKVYSGRQSELADPVFIDIKRRQEAALKAKVAADSALKARLGDPWADMAHAQAAVGQLYPRYSLLERDAGNLSQLYAYARTLVRAAAERAKPDGARLREYGEARLPLIATELLAPRPIDGDLETLYLGFWLSKAREYLGADDPAVRALLGPNAPESLARQLVAGTRLADPAVRKALWDGGQAAIDASADPLIRLAAAEDGFARAAREPWEERVSGPAEEAAARIAEAEVAVYGPSAYPDATFTPRLTFGRVAGWTYRDVRTGPFTDFAGLYARATGAEPYVLPPSWLNAKGALDGKTVFDLTASTDIVGGNSGSPLIDADGRMIGLVFDGNIHSLGGEYAYDGAVNRTIALSAQAIGQGLDKVYDDQRLLQELRTP